MSSTYGKDDLAFGKPVMELCNHPEYLTDDTIEYGGNDRDKPGYLGAHWPTFITVDLLKEESVGAICLKLWDWDDKDNKALNKDKNTDMQYAYRLLVSRDLNKWTVLFDSADVINKTEKFQKGWQCFAFEPINNIRYIRIHCLRNKKNSGFHIVKLKAFPNSDVDFFKNNTDIKAVHCETNRIEIGDGAPLSFKLTNLAGQIQEIKFLCNKKFEFFNIYKDNKIKTNDNNTERDFFVKLFNFIKKNGEIVGCMFKKAHEVEAIETDIDETRNLIADPIRLKIQDEIKQEQNRFDVDYFFEMFQFAMVGIMYYVGKNHFGWVTCLVALVLFLLIYFYFKRDYHKSVAEVSEGNNKEPKKIPAQSICDSEGNGIQVNNETTPEAKGISVLFQNAFWPPNDESVNYIKYNEKEGYHSVSTPGWIEFDFGEERKIKYLRFLLWDNNGFGKRLPSHRFYNYRIVFRESEKAPWKVLHDTMGHGSRGWQEFINESKNPWEMRFVRVYGISNSGTTGSGELWLVRLGISEEKYDSDLGQIHTNRIVKYSGILEKDDNTLNDFNIKEITKVIEWLRKPINSQADWIDSVKSLLGQFNEQYNDQDINDSLLSFFKKVYFSAKQKVIESYKEGSAEDFVQDVQLLVSDTLKPVQNATEAKKRFDEKMQIPKSILVLVATGPMLYDCYKEKLVIVGIIVSIIALLLLFLIFKSSIIKKIKSVKKLSH